MRTFAAKLTVMDRITKAQVRLVRSLQQKKVRDELGLFVAEGDKCVEELRKGFECVALYREGENATRVEIEQMSGLKTPQGVIGVFKKPIHNSYPQRGTIDSQFTNHNSQIIIGDLVLALDGIQDPGNLGTIIRTCDWFGVHDIFCSLDTADCYNPKVVQATMGALTRVRLHYLNLPEWLKEIKNEKLKIKNSQITNHQSQISNFKSQIKIYGTLLDGKDMYEVLTGEAGLSAERSISETVYQAEGRSIIVMGNEGNGISQAVRSLITHPIRIPSYPKNAETSESLNVSIATAIVLAEFRRLKI